MRGSASPGDFLPEPAPSSVIVPLPAPVLVTERASGGVEAAAGSWATASCSSSAQEKSSSARPSPAVGAEPSAFSFFVSSSLGLAGTSAKASSRSSSAKPDGRLRRAPVPWPSCLGGSSSAKAASKSSSSAKAASKSSSWSKLSGRERRGPPEAEPSLDDFAVPLAPRNVMVPLPLPVFITVAPGGSTPPVAGSGCAASSKALSKTSSSAPSKPAGSESRAPPLRPAPVPSFCSCSPFSS
mmetsp:Transcript_11607/g.46896  ORF Transcript_11607/g.46896 Transcript_11607/m.46896 type:complete len:240 (-) Transcript_11607:2683-3402(-)